MQRRRRIVFSQADVSHSRGESNHDIIRPKENLDVMVGENGMDLDGGEESKPRENEKKSNPNPKGESEEREEGEEEEGRTIRGPKAIYTPSKEEWDNHMRSHIPFRRWCPFCVKGRSKSGAHRGCEKSEDEKKKEVPVISIDYMEPKSEEEKKRLIKSLPIIGMIDRHD